MTKQYDHRGGFRSARATRPAPVTHGQPRTTAFSTSLVNTPRKADLRAELEEAARNTARAETEAPK